MSLLLLFGGEAATEPPAPGERIAVTRELPPDKLAARIEPPSGAPSRWAADEPLAENVIENARLSDEMPGGDVEGGGMLGRNPRTPWPDLAPFSNVVFYLPGVEGVANYRLDKAPESDGERMSISPAAVGWKQALEDDNALIGPGFIDSDLSKWGDPSTQRKINFKAAKRTTANTTVTQGSAGAGSALAALIIEISHWGGEWTPTAESWYHGGGVDIGAALYDFIVLMAAGTSELSHQMRLSANDLDEPNLGAGTTHLNTAASNQSVSASSAGAKYAFWSFLWKLAGEGNNNGDSWGFVPKVLSRLATENLALQGTWPNVGYTVSQMLGVAIPLHTPLRADPEDLEDTGYIVQQAWFSDPGPMSQVVQELTKYELLDHFVFGEKRFKLKRPGTYGRRWQAYAGPSSLQEQGFDASRSWKEILVTAQDVDGSTLSVGPLGSGGNVETSDLEITDSSHPAVRAAEAYGPNFLRKDRLDLGRISTPARMIEAGEIWLREANELNRSGSATLSGYVMDDRGVLRPVSQVRAGDLIRFPDAGDTGYRKIVRRNYEHNTRTVSVDLDAPPEGLKALLERMQADIQSLALS